MGISASWKKNWWIYGPFLKNLLEAHREWRKNQNILTVCLAIHCYDRSELSKFEVILFIQTIFIPEKLTMCVKNPTNIRGLRNKGNTLYSYKHTLKNNVFHYRIMFIHKKLKWLKIMCLFLYISKIYWWIQFSLE